MPTETEPLQRESPAEYAPQPGAQQTAIILGMALLIVVCGTAAADHARLVLLWAPLSFLLAAYGAGQAIGRAGGQPAPALDLPPIINVAVNVGVGIACLSVIGVLSAMGGVFWIAGIVAIPLTGFGLWQAMQARFWVGLRGPSAATALAGIALGATWLLAWLWGTIPPVFFDELAYHLVVPQRAIATSSLEAVPWVFFTLMPHASDLLLAWGHSLAGGLGARATHFAIWIACGLGMWALISTLADPTSRSRAALFTAFAIASSPTLWFMATLTFAETCLALAMVTAVILVAMPWEDRRPWLALGLALGLVGTVKLAGVFWIAAGAGAMVVARWPWRDMARSLLVTMGCLLPWWMRAFVHTGNPIYPMGYRYLGGTNWDDTTQARVIGDLAPSIGHMGIRDLLSLPLDLVLNPERFGSASDIGVLAIVALCTTVILPLIFRVAGLANPQRQRMLSASAVVSIACVGWLLTSTTTRYLAPAFVISLAVLAAVLLLQGPRVQMTGVVVLLILGLWGTARFIDQHATVFASTGVALGLVPEDRYLSQTLDHDAAARFVRTRLPENAYLLFIGETRPYYFDRKAMAPSAYDQHPLAGWVEESESAEGLAAGLVEKGFTHVVLNVGEYQRLRKKHGVLRWTGVDAETHDRRLKQLPSQLSTVYSAKGIFVLELPKTAKTAAP